MNGMDFLEHVRISEVYTALTGVAPRRTGRQTWRGKALWRGGDGFNVAMDDSRAVWHDFPTGEGGRMLDLVQRAHGVNRADALRFVADLAGVTLERDGLTREERRQYAQRRESATAGRDSIELWLAAAVADLNRKKIVASSRGDDEALAAAASLCNVLENGSAEQCIKEYIRCRAVDAKQTERLIAARRVDLADAENVTWRIVDLLTAAERSR